MKRQCLSEISFKLRLQIKLSLFPLKLSPFIRTISFQFDRILKVSKTQFPGEKHRPVQFDCIQINCVHLSAFKNVIDVFRNLSGPQRQWLLRRKRRFPSGKFKPFQSVFRYQTSSFFQLLIDEQKLKKLGFVYLVFICRLLNSSDIKILKRRFLNETMQILLCFSL